MLSRHADSAYWIGRYIERAEATARMIDVHYHFGLESPLVGDALRWSSILAISGQQENFRKTFNKEDERSILQFFAFDESNGSSIGSCIRHARENARSIRDQISSEMWECLNRTYLDYRDWNVSRVLAGSPFEFFQWVKDRSHLFSGIAHRTLLLGEARDFLDAGRFLERADQTARILDVKYYDLLPKYSKSQTVLTESAPVSVGGPVDLHGWTAVLKSVGAYEAFCKTYREGVSPTRVAEFLVLNRQFPASVRHAIENVDGCLRRISGNRDLAPKNSAEREVGRLFNDLNYISAPEIVSGGLHEFLEDVEKRCNAIGTAIFREYLSF